jgi:single-stranded DNA-binding protein
MEVWMNHVPLVGTAGQYGVKIAWTKGGKPRSSLTVIVEEPGKDKATYKTFIPVLIVGSRAEEAAETLEPGGLIAIESGKLAYKAGETKDSGKLMVVAFNVERLAAAPAFSEN